MKDKDFYRSEDMFDDIDEPDNSWRILFWEFKLYNEDVKKTNFWKKKNSIQKALWLIARFFRWFSYHLRHKIYEFLYVYY